MTTKAPKPPSDAPRWIETLTIAWMLSVMTTLACEIMAGSARLAVRSLFPEAQALQLFGGFLMFSALVIGSISLILGGIVLWTRPQRPPSGVIVFWLTIAAVPWIVAALQITNP